MVSALVTGWGRTAPARTELVQPDRSELPRTLLGSTRVVARGLGRAYGDCAVAGGGLTISTVGWNSIEVSDGRATVGAGVSLDDLLRTIVPLGWFVPVTPGTRFVTIGGAIAADVHGKSHHVDGSFGAHIESFELVTGSGECLTVTPEADSEAFWATVGGMGLTGVVTSAVIRLLPIESSRIAARESRHADLDDLMSAMVEADRSHRYSVAWVDGSPGRVLGRGVLSVGDHAPLDALSRRHRGAPLAYSPRQRFALPRLTPPVVLAPGVARAFNEFWYRKAPRTRRTSVVSISSFFHPLDGVADWNRVYGPPGFVQYQFVVPDSAADVVRTTLEHLAGANVPSYLAVLKRFGEVNPGMLSFPMRGWTLALDVPAGADGVDAALDRCDEEVVSAGGRVYLAKDARLDPRHLPAMYPRLPEFRAARRRLDPDGRMQSNLSRRLGL